ncbi:coiled-coil domain-containing protein 154-like isoform X8 [Mercenaria mercenaria]|uniref:coiled-coil domain-containing protein 154-like isoform X8 n=1 Tax=Mercenaria mercenaria TaxID=6596 RepID=UPI00234F3271|nr:coiled-coil domain-containing protein 154-like isoform X8 [Mercenaria mercenaria]
MDRAGNSVLWKKLHDPQSFTPRNTWPQMQNQFPSKYEQLPGIGGETPRSHNDNQLVALRSVRKGSPARGRDTTDNDTEERVRQLEMRLAVSEKSNRALLEEVLRLQNDLRNTSKRSEDVLREERDSRQQLSEAIKISNELISQLSMRIKETEDKIEDEKESLNALFSHTKNVEKSVVHSQQEIQNRRDAQQMKLQELRSELNETKTSRNQLEQATYALSEELRSLKNRMENQQSEFTHMITDVRNRARKLEDENRVHELDSMRKQSDFHTMTDATTTQLRGQVETRLSELRDVLMDLRGKHETEQAERRNLEKMMQTKINELNTAISEQVRKREENMHTVDMVLREKEHAQQAERLQLNAKVTDTVEDVNKRLLSKEMKIREDIQTKYLQLEKLVQREQHSRQEYEKAAREDADRKWQTLKKVLEEELHVLKDNMNGEKGRNRDTIAKLDQGISIVEKQLAENKKQVDKVLAAEIKSRKIHESGTNEKLASVNEKLQIATSTLQQAIGGVSQNLNVTGDKIRRDVKQILNEQQQGSTRALSDLDARMNAIRQKLNSLEDMLDAKVNSKFQILMGGHLTNRSDNNNTNLASQSLSERMADRMESISKWQDATGDTLRELGRSVQTMPQDIYQLEEKFKLMKSETDSRVSHESDTRAREVELLRQELQTMKSRLDRQPKPASLQELEAMNVNVRKLADNLQTVKTVLGMKIQSEQKLRSEEVDHLQRQIDEMKRAMEPLVGRSHPMFVKDGDRDRRGNSPDVNNWGVYNAYKWLMWKSKLMFKLWEIRAKIGEKPNKHSPNRKADSSKPKTPTDRQSVNSPINKEENKSNADNDSTQASPTRKNNDTPANGQTDKNKDSPVKSRNPSVASNRSGNGDPKKVSW